MDSGLGWVAELAWHEWGVTPERFWDDRPNAGTLRAAPGPVGERITEWVWIAPDDYGITVEVLEEMLAEYHERRRRELHAQGSVTAVAVNDPKRLSELAPPVEEQIDTSDSEFASWDWKGGE